jgi:hypothetical protein
VSDILKKTNSPEQSSSELRSSTAGYTVYIKRRNEVKSSFGGEWLASLIPSRQRPVPEMKEMKKIKGEGRAG